MSIINFYVDKQGGIKQTVYADRVNCEYIHCQVLVWAPYTHNVGDSLMNWGGRPIITQSP